ncbi:MAG: transposase zinc-binding domain-containing protein [bacterium]
MDPPGYAHHRPENTQLYQLVERYLPEFRRLRARAGRPLPPYVEEEFDACLKCGRLEEGFLRLRCERCRVEKLVTFSCRKRGFRPSRGARRMAETAALLADGVLHDRRLWRVRGQGSGAPVFRAVRSPGAGEQRALLQRMAERIGSGVRSDAAGRASADRAHTVHGRYRCRAGRVALDDRGAGEGESGAVPAREAVSALLIWALL